MPAPPTKRTLQDVFEHAAFYAHSGLDCVWLERVAVQVRIEPHGAKRVAQAVQSCIQVEKLIYVLAAAVIFIVTATIPSVLLAMLVEGAATWVSRVAAKGEQQRQVPGRVAARARERRRQGRVCRRQRRGRQRQRHVMVVVLLQMHRVLRMRVLVRLRWAEGLQTVHVRVRVHVRWVRWRCAHKVERPARLEQRCQCGVRSLASAPLLAAVVKTVGVGVRVEAEAAVRVGVRHGGKMRSGGGWLRCVMCQRL